MFIDLLIGQSQRRMKEISLLSGLGDVKEATELIGAVNLICVGSQSKEEALERFEAAFLKGTRGGQSTGKVAIDKKLENIARLARMALDKNWEIRERRLSERS